MIECCTEKIEKTDNLKKLHGMGHAARLFKKKNTDASFLLGSNSNVHYNQGRSEKFSKGRESLLYTAKAIKTI